MPELEALRGAAAFVVFSEHFCAGLFPPVQAVLSGTPFGGVLNGPAAVVLFFVLSGFVLTFRPIRIGSLPMLASLAVWRWPRLAATVGVAGLIVVSIALVGGFPPADRVGGLHGAIPYLGWGHALDNGNWASVLWEALFGAFLDGRALHNPVLWTMHWELLGSLLAFGLASIVVLPVPLTVRAIMFGAASLAGAQYNVWLIPFSVGVLFALLHRAERRMPLAAGLGLAVFALLLWSMDMRAVAGGWAATARWMSFSLRFTIWACAESIAAVCLMSVALYQPSIRHRLGGSVGRFAGRMSFPVYLVHLPVMLSLGCWLYVAAAPAGAGAAFAGLLFAAMLGASVSLALPLAAFDRWWTGCVRRLRIGGIAVTGVSAGRVSPVSSAPVPRG